MNLDEFKSTWKGMDLPPKTNDEIKLMLQENRHPVLKRIRKQLTIELIGSAAFLLCYYTLFDGIDKPMFINAILIAALVVSIAHTLYGYQLAKYPDNASSLKSSLERQLQRFKLYALGSLISKTFYAAGLLLFFTYSIQLTTVKYCSLATIIVLFLTQLAFLYRIWAKRLKSLGEAVASLS
jgi:hypothetical protein